MKSNDELLNTDLFYRPEPEAAPDVKIININKRSHRRLTLEDKVRIIGLRYGSVQNFEEEKKPVAFIAKRTNIPYATVTRVLRFFISSNFSIKSLEGKKRPKFARIDDQLKEFLL